MTHMVCGYPSIKESQDIFQVLYKYSAYIEIQFPFSDPMGDGPIIERANKVSIDKGMTTEKCFQFIESCYLDVSKKKPLEEGLLIMTYYNIVFNYGEENFIKRARELGVCGFIIPDLPFDEPDGRAFRDICKKYDMICMELVSPSTSNYRMKKISKLSPQLIYAISQNMTTGSCTQFGEELKRYIGRLSKYFDCSIGVGFGVKTKQDVAKVCKNADFAIIGSEFIKKYDSGGIQELQQYLDEITE